MESASSKQRLIKNTAVLYVRTLVTMVISLYTSRVILQNLGVEDYGVYNVVGGFVAMFAIISSSLTGTTQRYLTYEIGKKEESDPQKIFGLSMNIHIGLVLVIVLLLETFGLWFLNNKLNIDGSRLTAANWVFQFSIIAFAVNVLSTPYNAIIIAHERMKAFAYMSLLEAILKLGVCYLIVLTQYDKLIVYAFLLLLIALLNRFIYGVYCGRNFPESKYKFYKDRRLYKEIFGFAFMNFIGAAADILCNQGVNIILNMFFGVAVNAARGIANSVQSSITRFVNDFTTALKPQIMKEYASGNHKRSMELCYMGSKFAFFLMLFFGLPVVMRAPYIMQLWLGMNPEYTSDFVILTLIMASIMVLSSNVTTVILANGNLKSFTFWIGGVRIMMLPVIYVVLKLGGSPQYAYGIIVVFELLALFVRLIITQRLLSISVVFDYLKFVISRILLITILCSSISLFFNNIFKYDFLGFCLETVVCIVTTAFVIFMFGINKGERKIIINKVFRKKI